MSNGEAHDPSIPRSPGHGTSGAYGPPPGSAPPPPGYPPQQTGYPTAPGEPPAYGYPQAPAYPQAQPHPAAPAYPQAPSNGTLAWAMGFLLFIPIPFLSVLVSGIVMASVYGSVSRRGPVARENARAAANWGITFALVSTSLLILHFILLFALTRGAGVSDFYPLGIPITLYGLVVLAHIVLVIVGTVRASGGKVTRVPFSIPFIRA